MTDSDLMAQEGMERRRFLKAAATVAWATPAILTLTANRAGAQSCIPANAPCDACAGVNCCIQGSDSVPCCCSDADDVTSCAGVCRTTAQCISMFPGGDPNDPDSCWYPQDIDGGAMMARSVHRPAKPKRIGIN